MDSSPSVLQAAVDSLRIAVFIKVVFINLINFVRITAKVLIFDSAKKCWSKIGT